MDVAADDAVQAAATCIVQPGLYEAADVAFRRHAFLFQVFG
jgi:hypothetical protein